MFIISLHMDWLYSRGQGASTEKIAVYLAQEARKHTRGKPLVVAWRQFQPNPLIRKTLKKVEEVLKSASIPLYEGIPRAMFALAKLAEYHAFKRNNKQN
jgi:acyl-CoA synthetase (NDP forming)